MIIATESYTMTHYAQFTAQYKLDGAWVPFCLSAVSIHEAFETSREIVGPDAGLSVTRIEEDDVSDLDWAIAGSRR